VYHKPMPEQADAHFAALQHRYTVIGLADYLRARADGWETLPPKPLVITFDDGHRSNYLLKELLEKHRVPATIFLCSSVVGTDRQFWFEIDVPDAERQALKRVPDERRLEILQALGWSETVERQPRQALSAAEIADLKGIVDFQSHTMFHPILPQSSPARAAAEISGSKRELEERFGLRINALAYPNGDYSDREINAARAAGYACALTLDFGFNAPDTPAFRLKRICVNDDAGLDELLVKASGVWGLLKAVSATLRAPLRGMHRGSKPSASSVADRPSRERHVSEAPGVGNR
jgi:peptidoglycan/xylan/chitin deacetylase (PgdA/CDA1 family)